MSTLRGSTGLSGIIERRWWGPRRRARYALGPPAAALLSTALLIVAPAPPARAECDPQELAKLIADDAAVGDDFGYSVAVSGNMAVIGARYDDHTGRSNAGSAYVFIRSDGVWTQQAKLTADDAALGDYFGISVALSGDAVVIGAYSDDHAGGTDSGSAYVFARSGGVWAQEAKLTASDAAALDLFGYSVAVFGDTAVIGAYSDDHAGGADSGSAYVFVRSDGVWTQQARLTASDATADDCFGVSVALSDDTTVIGALYDDHAGGTNAGSAYVFVRVGGVWAQEAKLTGSDAAAGDEFGNSVAVSGDTAVIGALYDDHAGGTNAGSAYVFVRSGGAWTSQARLTASDAAANDWFGGSVAVCGDTAVIGADSDDHAGGTAAGSAYVFVRSAGVWTSQAKLIAADAAASDHFGLSVAVSGDTAVSGAYSDDHAGGADAGSAYVFDLGCTGACCHADGSCAATTEGECTGAWHAEWADCLVAECPPPPDGDFDGDEDVDLDDFAAFAACLDSSSTPPLEPGCAPGNFDGDADVDLTDFAVFQTVFTGS